MILFQKDWEEHPYATLHSSTTNESFVDICYILEDMGVKNNLWPLALHNPVLADIDPFDLTYMTPELEGMITEECFENPWYYFREIARIPVQGSMKPSIVKANRGNIALWWCYFNHITTFLIQPRQTGKSVNISTLDRYLLNFGLVHSSIHALTKEDQLRRNDIERLKEYEEVLPAYLRRTTKKDPNNQEYIYVGALDNKYESHVPRNDEKSAYKVGRGFTSANIRIDEFAYITWLKATLTTILSTTNAAFVSARENQAHHGIILATTAGKKDERDGKYAYEILTNSFPFTDLIYDSRDWDDLKKMVTAGSSNGFAINCTFSHRQLGVSDELHYENIKKAMISGEDADRDYFNIWTSGGRGSPLTPDQLDMIRANQRENFVAEIDPKMRYMTKWYVSLAVRDQLMEEGNIVVGVDTSEAGGKDEIAMQYVDMNTLEVLGTCFIKHTNIIEYALWLFDQMMRWPKLTAIIERKSTGSSVIDQLLVLFKMNGVNAFKRLWNSIVQDQDRYRDEMDEIRRANRANMGELYTRFKTAFGYKTAGAGDNSRSLLYGQVLQEAVRHAMDRINDVKTIDQLLALEVINNRVDHPKGGHDDGVVAWLLPMWMAKFGQNLHYYGMDTSNLMSSTLVKKSVKEMTAFDHKQVYLRSRIKEVSEQLATSKDHFVVLRLENEIKNLAAQIVPEEGETFSVTDIITKTRDNNRLKAAKSTEKDIFSDIWQRVEDKGTVF